MAWLDDRLNSHPKIRGLKSDKAFRVWVYGITYSSGWGLRGMLHDGAQSAIGCTPRIRKLLVEAGLWDMTEDGSTVRIHDWSDHNAARDRKKEQSDARRDARREALNGHEPSDDEIHASVDVYLRAHPGATKREVNANVPGRKQLVFDSVDVVRQQLADEGIARDAGPGGPAGDPLAGSGV